MLASVQVMDGVHLVMAGVDITVGVIHVMAMVMAGDTAGDTAGAGDIQVMDTILLITHHIIRAITKELLMASVMRITLAE